MTLATALTTATAQLEAAGVDSPRVDAEELAAHVLGVRRGALATASATREQLDELSRLVGRRADRVPLQHLVGSVGFRYLEIPVGPGVFVPRPETESVVQACLDGLAGVTDPLCVDLCSGSGTIALSLANELPAGARVHAVERDPGAFDWLQKNVATLELPVTPHLGDAAEALPGLEGQLDLVASNPPYVEAGAQLQPEVGDHDPEIALWGGDDGLDVVRIVLTRALALLKPGGLLVFEHSDRQGRSAPAVTEQFGFVDVVEHTDLAGRDRYVTARLPAAASHPVIS